MGMASVHFRLEYFLSAVIQVVVRMGLRCCIHRFPSDHRHREDYSRENRKS